MSEIIDFWKNKSFFLNKEALIVGAREHYTEDFIANFAKWKNNLNELNRTMKEYLISVDFKIEYWYDLKYDDFCKKINNNIEQWIKSNNDIESKDMEIILQYIIDDHIDNILKHMNDKKYSLASLMQSIKIVKF